MTPIKIQVYDPHMCCPSGTCGPSVDPDLARFSGDLQWFKLQGVAVERYSLSSDPGAFMQQDEVKEALQNEGNECLPLIVVDGRIVSRGSYPSRSQLTEFAGIDLEQVEAYEGGSIPSSPADAADPASACGLGCNCGAPPSNNRLKTAVCLVAVLAVGGIVAYKFSKPKQSGAVNAAVFNEPEMGVDVSQTPTLTMPDVEPVAHEVPTKVAGTLAPVANPNSGPTSTPPKLGKSLQTDRKIGEELESLSALNKVATDQSTVFVYIPTAGNEMVSEKISTAVKAAQSKMVANNIKLGLYTLPATAPEYKGISAQLTTPAILVMSKGKGAAPVTGDITEMRLLQAYLASNTGGCGSGSACGPVCK